MLAMAVTMADGADGISMHFDNYIYTAPNDAKDGSRSSK